MFGHLAFSRHLRVRFRRPSPLSDERVKFYDIFLPSSSSSSSPFVVSPTRESQQPRPSYESKTRRENARPLTRSANFTDVRSIRLNARRLFLPSLNSETREIDAIPRNFLPGDRRTDARSTSDGDRRHGRKLSRSQQRAAPLPRETRVVRFFSPRFSVSSRSRPTLRKRVAPLRSPSPPLDGQLEFRKFVKSPRRLVDASNADPSPSV